MYITIIPSRKVDRRAGVYFFLILMALKVYGVLYMIETIENVRKKEELKATIAKTIDLLRTGDVREFRNMAVIPLFSDSKEDINYLCLSGALEDGVLSVEEVNEGGSVPELLANNTGDIPVLILDGEELAGAKQNRVVNTTILIPPGTKLVVPVSCTERGRWNYRSKKFSDSDVIMSRRVRRDKSMSVTENLNLHSSYRSDQSGVWDSIEEEARSMNCHSPTGAMRETFEQNQNHLTDYINAFELQPEQIGLLVFINGKVAGIELLSRADRFAAIYSKLIKSYSMEALYTQKEETGIYEDEVTKMMHDIKDCPFSHYSSVGLGIDLRFAGQHLVGSALVVEKTPVHLAFFRIDPEERVVDENIAELRIRRMYRMTDEM